ncbi:MAG: hypothetical protein ER33_13380 [Cyanobium sp. CACIAM 14]|nr:MAG: hypothetical protein ER33_13380 [Cyanobium sp. CACIAM 14]
MTPLFKKLNLTTQSVIHVLNAPNSFSAELEALNEVEVRRERKASGDFVLAFAITQAEADSASQLIASCTEGDAIVWMAYPKVTSRRYRCAFHRDPAGAISRVGRARASS